MNLYHLRYFATLAHLEHYTKAAEILSITQPSLSHAISSLEKELGVKLFEKDGRNVVLTKCGQAFLIDVEQALDMLDSSVNKLQMTGLGEGRIDIAELRVLSSTVVPNFVKGFLDSTPNKKIDFYFHSSTGLTSDMIQGLKERKYDIAFCSKMDNEPLIEFTPVAKQELVLIVPKEHPLESKTSIDLKESLAYPHIVFSKRSGLRQVIDKLFEKMWRLSGDCLFYGRRSGCCRTCRCRIWYCCRSEDADSFLHACIHHRNRNPILGKTLLYGYFKKCIPGTGCYEL